MSRIMIAGTESGCGKTTLTCGILKALALRGKKVTSFKCGPDYIDPMFHSKVIGVKSRNLDIFMVGEDIVTYLFKQNSSESEISVIEGVMGFYDGMGMTDFSSSNHLANVLDVPVVLVVNARGKARSLIAQIEGYIHFQKNKIAAVIINNTSETMYQFYKEEIEKKLNIVVLGYLPKMADIEIKSRHLGLVTADEILDLQNKLELLAGQVEKSIDISELINMAESAAVLEDVKPIAVHKIWNDVKIAVAYDSAFCFYYEDNLDLLKKLGAELIYFSPISDKTLPDDVKGIIIGGGYPELYVKELSENKEMLESIRKAIRSGVKVFAECGGFMYLQEHIRVDNRDYEMVGAIQGSSYMTDSLKRFGYVTLTAQKDTILCKKGETINAHEFHYFESTNTGDDCIARKPNKNIEYKCIVATDTIFAGFPHINLWSNIKNLVDSERS